MTLEVPFEKFVETANRLASGLPAFLTSENGGTRASVADPAKRLRIVSLSPRDPLTVTTELTSQGMDVFEGRWIPDDAPAAAGDLHVVSVAYRTEGTQPGLWVDAFPEAPTPVQAIKAMYDEFCTTGEVGEVAFEEFVRLAEPTVVVLGPSELRGFAASKDC